MRLLIITQKVDRNDPILGFFHRWIEEFAKHCESVIVICLQKGEHDLPKNVRVLSLGKEEGKSRIKYIWRFYRYILQERNSYDSVFVHMNQEYIILGGIFWRIFRKRVYMWRNHAKGTFLTVVAVWFSNKVFYTSPESFTSRFKKSVKMPVGVDTGFFKEDSAVKRMPGSVLFIGRISPIKKVVEFVEWLKTTSYTATIAGPKEDEEYAKKILEDLPSQAKYIGPVGKEAALKLYQTHELYVNLTPAGSFDKTIFEAVACGMKLKVENPSAQNINIKEHSLSELFCKLKVEME